MFPATGSLPSKAACALGLFVAFSLGGELHAQGNVRDGKQVVDATCIKCHGSGANGAPKIGDKAAWGKLAAAGLTSLSDAALKGIRQMPPHGGNPATSDTEIKRAITYMVNQSGGNWVEPTDRTAKPTQRTGEQIVASTCAKCHQNGTNGAPKVGDQQAWIPRLKQGYDSLVRSAINGHGGKIGRAHV